MIIKEKAVPKERWHKCGKHLLGLLGSYGRVELPAIPEQPWGRDVD